MASEITADGIMSNVLSPRYFFRATLLVMAEAGVWTEMSYLPQWLLTTTTVLAALCFLVLTFEPTIRQRSHKLAQLASILYVGFFAVVLYGFLAIFSARRLTQTFG